MVNINNLSFSYGNKKILKDVSIHIDKGTLCGLLGPNGSGKSTLFKCCLNFLKYRQGAIFVDGKDISNLSPSALSKIIAYVPQEHKPPFPFTVREMVLMGRTPHMGGVFSISNRDNNICQKAMATVGIEDIAEEPCTMLSGGQRQLVLIARALAQDAPVMILDEPTSALDFSNQIKIWKIMKKIAAQGVTILACSHDPNHILWFSNMVAAISDGCIVAYGKTEETLDTTLLNKIFKNEYLMGTVDNKKIIYPAGV